MKTFQINDRIEIICESGKTRNGFKHTATLLLDGNEAESVKCTYLKRTWESYEYQSVLSKLVDKSQALSEVEKETAREFVKSGKRVEDDLKPLKTTATIAMLGDLFGKTTKESNDWKTRMLKAGLENKGLDIPADWDELSEKEKAKRLDEAIDILNK